MLKPHKIKKNFIYKDYPCRYEALASVVIYSAVYDWYDATNKLIAKNFIHDNFEPKHDFLRHNLDYVKQKSIERFFQSDWFRELCQDKIDGEILIEKLKSSYEVID